MRLALLLSIGAFLTVVTAHAQVPGASLTIRLGDANRFRVGEIIPVELAFSAATTGTYDMDTRTYDRSGRLDEEQFHVSPPGRDPLYNHYHGGLYGGYIGGGLSSGPKLLTSRPEIIQEELNEWVALDKPGHYALYVTSSRVSRRTEQRNESVTLRSNTIEFEVVEADSAWQDAKLAFALAVLNGKSSTDKDKTSAARILRFLDSPGSIRLLVALIMKPGDERRWDFTAGLKGSQNLQMVLQELESQWSNPDAGITEAYLTLLGETRFLLTHPPMLPYPEGNTDAQKAWQALYQNRTKEFSDLMDNLFQQAAGLIGTKRGPARAETIRTLLQRPARSPSELGPLSSIPSIDLASAFLDLTPDQQYILLSSYWGRLKAATFTPALVQLLGQAEINHQLLRDMALQRLHELDRAKAAPFILAEIKQPHLDSAMSTVKAKTLGLLPETTLPQFDELLARRIADPNSRTLGLDAGLISRYSTATILPQVKAKYESVRGPWACGIADGFMDYFLRVDQEYGVAQMAKWASTCSPQSLKTLMRIGRWNDVEPAVIAELNDPERDRARGAAEVLSKCGGPKARLAILDRLRRFHEEWAGRERELSMWQTTSREAFDAVTLQSGLVQALGHAQRWLLTDQQVDELQQLALGSIRESVARLHWKSPLSMSVSVMYGTGFRASLGGELYSTDDLDELCDKLSQFPKETTFELTTFGQEDRASAAIRSIEDVAALHGLRIIKAAR